MAPGIIVVTNPDNRIVEPDDSANGVEGDTESAADGDTQLGGTTTEQSGNSNGNDGEANDSHAGQTWHLTWE